MKTVIYYLSATGNSLYAARFLQASLEGAELRCLGRSPLGDPAAYCLCGAVLALRDRDADLILVERREE